ncbi:unnamed protein product [Amoebophrya sp. A25]|nr:unnamed protein product [Amoebophrya sp. A25]|eukprot:GSA25T00014986001.1
MKEQPNLSHPRCKLSLFSGHSKKNYDNKRTRTKTNPLEDQQTQQRSHVSC